MSTTNARSEDGAVSNNHEDEASRSHYLDDPMRTEEVQRLFDEDIDQLGYVMNVSKLWAYQPTAFAGLFALLQAMTDAAGLTLRQRGILVAATASTLGDSYCSLAWGARLARAADAGIAAGVLGGDDDRLTPPERAMARWARKITEDPNVTTAADIQSLRDAGFTDGQIFAMTTFVALRIAFSTVNASLGAGPDAGLRASVPEAVLDAVSYGRPIDPAT